MITCVIKSVVGSSSRHRPDRLLSTNDTGRQPTMKPMPAQVSLIQINEARAFARHAKMGSF